MAEVISLKSRKNKKAAGEGFREWRRIFQSITGFNEDAKWSDLPDEVILFFCEEGPASKHAFYDLLMRSNGLGTGHDFESQGYERLSTLLNAYFFMTDQARFEGMRRLGWVKSIPRADKSIIEVVMESASYDYPALLEAPEPTPAHPAYEEDRRSRGVDRAALVRKHIQEAIRQLTERVQKQAPRNIESRQL